MVLAWDVDSVSACTDVIIRKQDHDTRVKLCCAQKRRVECSVPKEELSSCSALADAVCVLEGFVKGGPRGRRVWVCIGVYNSKFGGCDIWGLWELCALPR